MFDLEESVAEWRQQMLGAGIEPAALEELEGHLREEFERQAKSEFTEQEAFDSAIQKIGQVGSLKTEFAKTSVFPGWFGDKKIVNIVKRKIGVSVVVASLFIAVVLQFTGSPLVARVSRVSTQVREIGGEEQKWTMCDNFWQIRWYAFVFAGFFVGGIILTAMPKQETPNPVEN